MEFENPDVPEENRLGPVPLPALNEAFTEGFAKVSGWGTRRSGGIPSDALQWVQVPIVTDEECATDYAENGFNPETMICAGEASKDSCQVSLSLFLYKMLQLGVHTCNGVTIFSETLWGRRLLSFYVLAQSTHLT